MGMSLAETQEVKVHCVLLLFLQFVLRLVSDIMAASTEPSTLDVVTAIQRLPVEKTRELVFRLGVQDYVLDNIDYQYGGTTRNIKYVGAWLDRDTDASWGKLVFGLREIGMNVLAKEVESTYISKCEEAAVPTTSSASLISATPPPQLSVDTPDAAPLPPTVSTMTATAKPLVPVINPTQSPAVNMGRVAKVRAEIENFEETFSNLKSDTRQFLSDKESQNPKFLARFRDHLLDLPVSKRAVHCKFFDQKENQILNAENIEKIFAVLRPYCNYSNYDIILHLVKKFCDAVLRKRMLDYRDSFQSFEIDTTIDIFLAAISACSEMCEAFSRMATKINKPGNECTLYDVRQVKEAIAKAASLHSYSVYIESVAESLVLMVPPSCVTWVGMAVTPHFMQAHHLAEVSIDGKDITFYQDKEHLVC